MGDSSEMVTVTCPDHHQTLIDGLWHFLQSNYGVDFAFKYAGREVSAHHLILDLFLSPDKLQETVAERQPSQQPDNKSEMDCLLQFLYRGTVAVPKPQLGILLELARQSDFRMLVNALQSSAEVGEPEMNLVASKRKQRTTEVQKFRKVKRKRSKTTVIPVSPPKVHDNLVTESRQSVIETEDDLGNVIIRTEDDYVYVSPNDIADPSVDQSHKPDNFSWDQPAENEADCHATLDETDDGIIGSCPTVQFDQEDFLPVHQADKKPLFIVKIEKVNPDDPESRSSDDGSESTDAEDSPSIGNTEEDSTDEEDNFESGVQCLSCSKRFSGSSGLRRHITVMHGKNSRTKETFPCDQCRMVFSWSNALKCHQLTHQLTRPHQCHLCELAFPQAMGLKRHLLTHGELNYKCVVCDLAFDSHSMLDRHVATHQV